MTYEQAEAIVTLETVFEMQAFYEEQNRTMLAEMEAQCGRGRNTSHGDFLYYSGLIEGMRRIGFHAILAEAKAVIKKKTLKNYKKLH